MKQLRQLATTFRATRERDPAVVLWMAGVGGGLLLVFLVIAALTGSWLVYVPMGVLAGLLGALIVLGRRAQRAAIAQIEGQPGAAAAVLEAMRGPWRLTPAVAFNRKEDMIHMVIGRPGVVLVAEGRSPARARQLLVRTSKKVARAAGDVPVTEVLVGDGDGEVPLSRLQAHLARLPIVMKAKEVGPLDRRLSAIGAQRPPMPKGPPPRPPRGKLR